MILFQQHRHSGFRVTKRLTYHSNLVRAKQFLYTTSILSWDSTVITLKPIPYQMTQIHLTLKMQLDEEIQNNQIRQSLLQKNKINKYLPLQRYYYRINICLSDQFQTVKIHMQQSITNQCHKTKLVLSIPNNIIYVCNHTMATGDYKQYDASSLEEFRCRVH